MQTAMTPLIDVVFQLLIFFICASTGHIKELLLVTDFRNGSVSPATSTEVEKPLGEVWLRLNRADDETVYRIEEREIRDVTELGPILKTLGSVAPEIPVNLDIAADVPLGDVIRAYDACRAARFRTINFAAELSRLTNSAN